MWVSDASTPVCVCERSSGKEHLMEHWYQPPLSVFITLYVFVLILPSLSCRRTSSSSQMETSY